MRQKERCSNRKPDKKQQGMKKLQKEKRRERRREKEKDEGEIKDRPDGLGRLDYKRGDDWKKEVKGKSWEGREKKGMEIERWGEEGERGREGRRREEVKD